MLLSSGSFITWCRRRALVPSQAHSRCVFFHATPIYATLVNASFTHGHHLQDMFNDTRIRSCDNGIAREDHGAYTHAVSLRDPIERYRSMFFYVRSQVMHYQTNNRSGYLNASVAVDADCWHASRVRRCFDDVTSQIATKMPSSANSAGDPRLRFVLDRHFFPQHWYWYDIRPKYRKYWQFDFLLRNDNLDADFNRMLARLGYAKRWRLPMVKPGNKHELPEAELSAAREALGAPAATANTTLVQICDIYRKDFDCIGQTRPTAC